MPFTLDIIITNPDGQQATFTQGFTFIQKPTVTSITPSAGPQAGGTFVTIIGTGFTPGLTVLFGTVPAVNVQVQSPTQLTCTTPAVS